MSKFVRMIKNMSKVQKMITFGVSSVVICGAVAGGVLWYNHSSNEAEIKAENEKIIAEAEDMNTEELSEFLDNNAVDEEVRKELEAKLDEMYAKEDSTIATKPTEDKKEETKPTEDKKEETSNSDTKPVDKPSTGGTTSNSSKPTGNTTTGGSSSNSTNTSKPSTGTSNTTKPSESVKPVEPTTPARPSGYSSSVTSEFWNWIDKGMVNTTSEDEQNIPRVHKDLKAKLDNITAGYVNKSKSASQTKNEILGIGWVPGWSYGGDRYNCKPSHAYVNTISVSGDLTAKQAGREIHNKWTNGSFEIPYSYVNCKVYYDSASNTYVAYIAAMYVDYNN